jgi:NAD(P)-dependent dehydrogenase (short-subunit alcohol dehydrogenase family)
MDQLRFDGRAVIVTGAGRGVGRGHAMTFASRGAKVVVADLGGAMEGGGRDAGPAEHVVKEIEAAGGEAVAAVGSVADENDAKAIVQTALDAFGRVDVVVNNAGIADPDIFADMTMARFRLMTDVHYHGTVQVCMAAWPHMIEAGYGRIVNTTSEGAFGTIPKATGYGGAKGGVYSFTRALALDAKRYTDIHVNMIAPRASTRMSSPQILAHTMDVSEEVFEKSPTLDAYRPELVSSAAVFLGHDSCTLDGETLVCGGGEIMRLAVIQNTGFKKEGLTPEDIVENLDAAMDMSNAKIINIAVLNSDR